MVPLRATRELPPEQIDALLAHELAHHARRDPLWHAVTRCLCAVFFFQPLHHVAHRRLRETSELLADAWAVERTGDREALAACLTVVAGWLMRHPAPLSVPAMAARGSMLERRVSRLVTGDTLGGAPRVLALLVLAPLLLVAVAAPAVAGRRVALATPAPVPTPVARRAAEGPTDALDAELDALRDEIGALADLTARVPDPPASLTEGVRRLRAHLQRLERDRDALRALAAHAKENNR